VDGGLVRLGGGEPGKARAEPHLAGDLRGRGRDLEALAQHLDRPALLAQHQQGVGEPAGVGDRVVPVTGSQVVLQCRLPLDCRILPLSEKEADQPAPHGLLG
jgi:hypothetical protein